MTWPDLPACLTVGGFAQVSSILNPIRSVGNAVLAMPDVVSNMLTGRAPGLLPNASRVSLAAANRRASSGFNNNNTLSDGDSGEEQDANDPVSIGGTVLVRSNGARSLVSSAFDLSGRFVFVN